MSKLDHFLSLAPKKDKRFKEGVNAVIYTRVSDSSQEDNTSLESQKKYCENFAQRRGFTVLEYFGGTYESAKTDDRKEFNKMLTYLRRSKNVSYIIVYSYERFSRSGISGAQIADDLLKDYGIVTLASTQELDPTTIAGSFQQKILFLFGQMDNEMRKDKTITGMRELVRKGYTPYSIPRGFVNLNRGKAVDQKIVVSDEGKIIRNAFLWKANENMTNANISRKLRTLGVNLDERRIGSILSNPYYCGVIVGKLIPEEVIEGKHEPMVSREIFMKVNNIVADNRNHPVSHNEDDENLPLKRFMKCGDCNKSMTGYLVRQKGLYYYKCRTEGCCNNKSAKSLHEQFKTLLSAFEFDASIFNDVKETLNQVLEIVFEDNMEKQTQLKTQLGGVNKKIETIRENLALSNIDREMYNEFNAKYKAEQNEIEKELQKYSIKGSNLSKAVDKVLKICANPLVLWEKSGISAKMNLQNMIFPDGIRYDRKTGGVRTNRINSLFGLIPMLAKELRKLKKGESIDYDKFSFRVTATGFKPVTLRAEI